MNGCISTHLFWFFCLIQRHINGKKKHKRNLFWGLQTWGKAFLFSLVSLPGLLFSALDRKENKTFYSPGSQTWWWRAGPEWVTTGPKRSGTPGRTCVQRQKAQSQFYCIALILQCWHNKSRCVDSGHTCWPPRTSSPSSSSGPRRSGCQTLGLTRAGSSRWSGAEGKKRITQVSKIQNSAIRSKNLYDISVTNCTKLIYTKSRTEQCMCSMRVNLGDWLLNTTQYIANAWAVQKPISTTA